MATWNIQLTDVQFAIEQQGIFDETFTTAENRLIFKLAIFASLSLSLSLSVALCLTHNSTDYMSQTAKEKNARNVCAFGLVAMP